MSSSTNWQTQNLALLSCHASQRVEIHRSFFRIATVPVFTSRFPMLCAKSSLLASAKCGKTPRFVRVFVEFLSGNWLILRKTSTKLLTKSLCIIIIRRNHSVSSDGSKLYALSPNFSVPSASALGPTSKRAAALISYARPVPYEYYEDKIQFFTILCPRKIFTEQFSCLHAKILALRARQQTTFGVQHRKSWCKHRDGGNSKKKIDGFRHAGLRDRKEARDSGFVS